jgi:hypothetical protein
LNIGNAAKGIWCLVTAKLFEIWSDILDLTCNYRTFLCRNNFVDDEEY